MVTRIEDTGPSVHTDMSSIPPRRDPATGFGSGAGVGAAGAAGKAVFDPVVAGVIV